MSKSEAERKFSHGIIIPHAVDDVETAGLEDKKDRGRKHRLMHGTLQHYSRAPSGTLLTGTTSHKNTHTHTPIPPIK